MLWKCCTQYASKHGKFSTGHKPGEGLFSFQSQRKAMPKNVQSNAQLHSSPMLVRSRLNSCLLGFRIMWIEKFQMPKLGLEKEGEPEIKLPTPVGSLKKQENSRETTTFASLTMLKPLTVWIIINCGKLLKRWEYQTILIVSWETYMWIKKQQLESCMEQLTGSRWKKKYDRAVCCHPGYLIYILKTSWEIMGWMS